MHEQAIIFNKWKGSSLRCKRRASLRIITYCSTFSARNNKLLVLKQRKGALNWIMPSLLGLIKNNNPTLRARWLLLFSRLWHYLTYSTNTWAQATADIILAWSLIKQARFSTVKSAEDWGIMFWRNTSGIFRWQHNSTKWAPFKRYKNTIF